MIFSFLKVKYLKVRTNRNFKKQVFIIHHRIGSLATFCWRFSVQLTVGSKSELFLLFLWILILISKKILNFLFWFLRYVLKHLKEHFCNAVLYLFILFTYCKKCTIIFYSYTYSSSILIQKRCQKSLLFKMLIVKC